MWSLRNLERPFDKHIDNDELNALVPWSVETGQELHGLSQEAVREAERHARSCVDCSKKVAKYRQLVGRFSNVAVSGAAQPGADCPKDIDWFDVAAGLWPEFKARQLIMHAALCDHCGPLLRAATLVDDDPTPQEERLLAELKPPSQPDLTPQRVPSPPSPPGFMRWLVPAMALTLVVGALVTLVTIRRSSPAALSGAEYAEFAVKTHRQYAQGNLALDVRSDSQQSLNEWLKAKSPFSLALPASPPAPGEERAYRLEGARLVQVASKSALYIAYQMQTGPVSLIVTPDSVASASGGIKVDFKKVSFHYRMVEGYKVVTWSLRGRTYAQVSQEGNTTQRSCMVCHSPMRDRDLSQTPTPLRAEPVLQ
jgi:anti-sigma factor RsiW